MDHEHTSLEVFSTEIDLGILRKPNLVITVTNETHDNIKTVRKSFKVNLKIFLVIVIICCFSFAQDFQLSTLKRCSQTLPYLFVFSMKLVEICSMKHLKVTKI